MKIYIAYKLSGAEFEILKKRLEEIDRIIKELKYETFIFIRDIQNWIPNGDPKSIIEKAMEHIKQCDIILSIVETKEKGEGMLLENGYARALGKTLIVASKPEGRAIMLKAMADKVFEYDNFKEFKEKLKKILDSLPK